MGHLLSLSSGRVQDALVLLAALGLSYHLKQRASLQNAQLPLPPRLKGLPLIGNALDMPSEYPGDSYHQWSKGLGSDIVSATFLGRVVVIANSIKVAMDLLDKRSAIYSSRPESIVTNELMGWDYLFGMLPYDERWKERRRTFVQHFRPGDMTIVLPQEQEFVARILLELEKTPDQFLSVIKGGIGGFIISLAYGIPVKPRDDPRVIFSEHTLHALTTGGRPGASFIEVIPALKYVPSWFPGAGFKRWAVSLSYMPEQFRTGPFDEAVAHLASDTARPSFTSIGLEAIDENSPNAEHQRQIIKDSAAMFYAAGTETIVASILTWLWALMKNQEVQAKVHAELDEVLKGRMPEITDQDSLPYLAATLLEGTRWGAPTAIGIPHLIIKDDIYNGYFIPKDSVVVGNIYAMLHNEDDYQDPYTYNPDRFLKDGEVNFDNAPDPNNYAFGFGRRACPGIHIGKSMVWLTAASLAMVYKWSEPLGEDGRPIDQPQAFTSGLLHEPRPFKCDFKVRSAEAQEHLRNLSHGQ